MTLKGAAAKALANTMIEVERASEKDFDAWLETGTLYGNQEEIEMGGKRVRVLAIVRAYYVDDLLPDEPPRAA